MSIQPNEYQSTKLGFAEPTKAEGSFDYATIKFTYSGKKFDLFLPGTPDAPGVKATKIGEDPKKPGKLTQGVFTDGNVDLLKMGLDIENQALDAIIKYKDHKSMPPNIAKFKDVQQLKDLFPSIKGVVHHPKVKDAQGKPTNVVDPSASPMIYYSLMRASLTGDKKGEIFTKYYSARMLDQDIDAAIKRGERKTSDFLFPVLTNPKTKQQGLFESKSGMRMIPTIMVGDIYISADKIKIRLTISDAYILGFVSGEPESRAKAAQVIAAAGIKMTEDLVMPSAPEENQEGGGEPSNTVNNKIDGAPAAAKGYTVQIVGE